MVDAFARYYDGIVGFMPRLPGLLTTLLIGYLVIQLLEFLMKRFLRLVKIHESSRELIVSIGSVILWVLLFAEIAREAGLSGLALTISGSIVALGFAIANGATSLTSDIIAGLFMSRDRDFDCGYRIRVGDVEGVVDKIDIRKVRIKGDDGKLYILPSSKVDMTGWVVISKN
jgi:small-conductance mechanosensitive channel